MLLGGCSTRELTAVAALAGLDCDYFSVPVSEARIGGLGRWFPIYLGMVVEDGASVMQGCRRCRGRRVAAVGGREFWTPPGLGLGGAPLSHFRAAPTVPKIRPDGKDDAKRINPENCWLYCYARCWKGISLLYGAVLTYRWHLKVKKPVDAPCFQEGKGGSE
jgi:hypothetical protein